jgi:L-alanine-DL-glutamate epimerase-like enolase superfamily enzyme
VNVGAPGAAISRVDVSAFTVPLEEPEADGTLTWDATTVVVVEVAAADETGLGFTYGTPACASVVLDLLIPELVARDALDVSGAWLAMVRAIRNQGRPGIASMAIAAADTALWDLKAKLVGLPLADLLGRVRDEVPVYGSGGFTSFDDRQVREQLGGWVHGQRIPRVKMKIGADRGTRTVWDLERIRGARDEIGPEAELFVDANGAYTAKQAVRLSRELEDLGVSWFEEPVSSDDLEGLALVKAATSIDVAAGEYGYDLPYFERMAPAVDVLQADVSRCAGITEWVRAAAIAAEHGLEVSGHCAQSLHAHVACSVPNLRHLEYFADHARVDRLLFDGVLDPDGGALRPARDRPGLGLQLKRADAERFAA